jgi:hypothetical protein
LQFGICHKDDSLRAGKILIEYLGNGKWVHPVIV